MKKRTMLYAFILSVMLIFSAFAVGCNNNSANNDSTPATDNTAQVNDDNGGDGSTTTETDTATSIVIAAAEKTAALFQNESNYTIEERYENNIYSETVIKYDGTKIAVGLEQSEVGGASVYFDKEITGSGVKYYMYSMGMKMEVSENYYKELNSIGSTLSAMFPTFTQSKWIQGENADTFTSTITANGMQNYYTIKIENGYIVEIKCEITASSVNMTYGYKIYDIGTTVIN